MSDYQSLFKQELKEGLGEEPKRISSKWFYDQQGDELFVQIMQLPEYYLTRAEEEIFKTQTAQLAQSLTGDFETFDLFELGAGDGQKTFHFLRELDPKKYTYRPIDISSNAVNKLQGAVSFEFPNVQVDPIEGEYFHALEHLKSDRPKAILFMGSNIGNLLDERANEFLKRLSATMQSGDTLLLGVDLKKAKEIVLPAYNDSAGVTAAFNLNVLQRINRELGGDFDLRNFEHAPVYNEEEGIAYSYLRSTKDQQVTISAINGYYKFSKGEKLFTEISRKYDDTALEVITRDTSLELTDRFFDGEHLFCDAVYRKR
ncbi:MAG: L-histidine N(alpha)-methyltransferase [Flavobacteriales bacterium]|nr:L-histidine N(alpha)-methyltransferase [Flavobacteriales bacterium]